MGSSVLVVEDEPPMQVQLRLDLTDLSYQVRVAGTAEEAKRVLTHERVAGVLLDLVLDEGEEAGLELLRWIRQNHPGLPVVVLSAAQGTAAAISRAYELGASSYFVKGTALMAHVYSDIAARLIEGGTGRAGNYRFGRLDFDPTHRAMRLGQKQTRLTSQQTRLVVHLAQGSKPVTAGELIAAGLFRPNAARSTVHSALLTLRRKLNELEPELGAKLLESTPRGYSVRPIV
ncbi:MAG TPA: response regulator [Candidatus Dormibacteraeota bacterium]|nr:response regulator [Candidatus Dormibacteraeota bacterium]